MNDLTRKLQTVKTMNTFYFFDNKFEEEYESHINSIKETLLVLKHKILNNGLKKELFEELLLKKEHGLRALLALTGFSNESLKRLITFTQIIDDTELNSLIYKDKWVVNTNIGNKDNIKEWSDIKMRREICENEYFRKGLVNIFFEGSTVPVLNRLLPLFEVKKLSIAKLNFETDALIDTLIRYKEKGSYSGKTDNNPETVIKCILEQLGISFEKGDLEELVKQESNIKRTMDFIIPNKANPKVIVECSYLVTTSSGQGDKAKTENQVKFLLKKHYPMASFLGMIDGIGWYVRTNDLKRMVEAYEDVFTFHQLELERFKHYMKKVFSHE